MALVSLKQDADEEYEVVSENPYGYGTEIRLNGEQCEAMGILEPLRAGQKVTIQAIGIVRSATEELEASDDSGGKDVYLCIQLTDMDLKADGAANASAAASMLYGGDAD